jgi:hypothetical protein
VGVSTLFTAGGLWLAVASHEDRRPALGVVAFFGLCLGVSIWMLLERLETQRSLAARSVEIVGSIRFRARGGRGAALSATVAAVMLVVAWAWGGSVAGWIAAATALLCGAIVPVILFGPPSRCAIVFEPAGLLLVQPSFALRVPWDQIAEARILDIEQTLIIALTLRDPAGLKPIPRARHEVSSVTARRVARSVAMCRRWSDCDLTIGPAVFGLDAVLFLRAIETYVSDPGKRDRLAPRPELEAAP